MPAGTPVERQLAHRPGRDAQHALAGRRHEAVAAEDAHPDDRVLVARNGHAHGGGTVADHGARHDLDGRAGAAAGAVVSAPRAVLPHDPGVGESGLHAAAVGAHVHRGVLLVAVAGVEEQADPAARGTVSTTGSPSWPVVPCTVTSVVTGFAPGLVRMSRSWRPGPAPPASSQRSVPPAPHGTRDEPAQVLAVDAPLLGAGDGGGQRPLAGEPHGPRCRLRDRGGSSACRDARRA